MVNFLRNTQLAILLCSSLLISYGEVIAQSFTLDSTTIVADTVFTGLNIPWELKWGNDDHLWLTEREGKVSRVNPQTGTRTIILDISQANGGEVYQISESGMLGFTFHPQFPDSSYLYVAYTYRVGGSVREKLVKYEYTTDTLINPFTLIEDILGSSTHNGSRLVFGPDDKLYMTTGDAQIQPNAQNITNLSGKVLRFNTDGTIPSDNPIAGSPVWSWGHRNAQGLVFGPTGILYSSEHGPNTDDEINIIQQSRNYGWPNVAGLCNTTAEIAFCNDSNVVESIYNWTPTIAPSDLIYYNHPSIPEWNGTLLVSVLKNKRIIRLTLNATGDSITSETSYFVNQWGRLRDICFGPDGAVYLATNGETYGNNTPNTHTIIRLQNPNYLGLLQIDAGQDIDLCNGDSITINPVTSGGVLPYNYSWSPSSNLSCTTCPNPVVQSTLTDSITYTVSVTDNNGTIVTDTLRINLVPAPSNISYTVTILDTLGNPSMVELNIDAPFADSVVVVIDNDTTTILNTQNFNLTDSVSFACTTADPVLCSVFFDLCIYAYTQCGVKTLCESVDIPFTFGSSIKIVNTLTFELYPNPTSDQITLSGLKKADKILILNATGVVVKEISNPQILSGEYTLKLETLPSGVYFISVSSYGLKGIQKLIKH